MWKYMSWTVVGLWGFKSDQPLQSSLGFCIDNVTGCSTTVY